MCAQFEGHERRKFKRAKIKGVIICTLTSSISIAMVSSQGEVEAEILDLSEGGMGLLVNQDIPLSANFSIKFIIVKEGESAGYRYRPIKIEGETRSCVPAGENKYRLGICFTQVTAHDWPIITNFMKSMGKGGKDE